MLLVYDIPGHFFLVDEMVVVLVVSQPSSLWTTLNYDVLFLGSYLPLVLYIGDPRELLGNSRGTCKEMNEPNEIIQRDTKRKNALAVLPVKLKRSSML